MTWSARAVALDGLVSPLSAVSVATLGWVSATAAIGELDGPYAARVTPLQVLAAAAQSTAYGATPRPAWLSMVPTERPVLGAAVRLTVLSATAAPAEAHVASITRS